MSNENLKNFLAHIISRLKDDGQIEESKLELKSKWYDFNSKTDKSEFLKDIVALANTPGLEGYLIIGIDEKSGNLYNSLFKDSGLNDIVDLHNLLIKSVDRPFDFQFKEIELVYQNERKTLSIFTIPPSINKPHVIKYYLSKKNKEIQNFIPIRKSTGIFPANRSDIDFMYYDRKNIEPEYAIEIKSYNPQVGFNSFSTGPFRANLQLCFQNYGRKPVAIVRSQLIIAPIPDQEINEEVVFRLYSYRDMIIQKIDSTIQHRYITIPSNQIETLLVTYLCEKDMKQHEMQELNTKIKGSKEYSFIIKAYDIEGNIYSSKKFSIQN